MSAVAHESIAVTRTDSVRVRRITSTLLAAAAVAFLLPFGTVSCSGEKVTVTGVELATYSVEGADEPDSLAAEVETHGLFALVALVLALIGAAVAAVRDRGGGWAVGGLCSLFVLAFNNDTLVLGPELEFGVGYVLACSALVFAGLARFHVRVETRLRNGDKVWQWWLALVAGAPVTALLLVLAGVSG